MLRNLKIFIWKSLLAGVAIGIAALCFLKSDKVVGAALFAFGLSAIIISKWKLFTGACGFSDYKCKESWRNIFLMLIVNAVGVAITAFVGASPEAVEKAELLAEARFSMNGFRLFGCAVLCGFIMTVSVGPAKKGNWIPLLLGIPTFVLCGFPHCVADVAYYALSGKWGLPWLITIAGNFLGCNIPSLTLKDRQPLCLSE